MKTNLDDLLTTLADQGFTLRLDGEHIRVRGPKARLTAALRDAIATHKPALVTLLQRDAARAPSPAERPLEPVSRTGELPLSFAEQRLWFLNQLEGVTDTYSLPSALRIEGALDVDALTWSMNQVVRRHEILRTLFQEVQGAPVRVIRDELRVDVPVVELADWVRGLRGSAGAGDARDARDARDAQDAQDAQDAEDTGDAGDTEALVRRWVRTEAQKPFDLGQGPLLRVSLLRVAAREHILLVNMHHIVSDGWSMSVLVREFAQLYNARLQGREPDLPPLPIQYTDYAYWQRKLLDDASVKQRLEHWRKKLEGAPPLISLPLDHPRPAIQTYEGTTESFLVPAEVSERLATLARGAGTTLYVVLLATFKAFLARYCHQLDIVVGTTFANRPRAELEGLIGFFVNTLALRTQVSSSLGFRELVAQVSEMTVEAYAHSDIPFERIVEVLQPDRSLSHAPVVQVIFDFHNTPEVDLSLSGLTVVPLPLEGLVARFDLILDMKQTPRGLQGVFEYNTSLFEAATIRRMVVHFQRLLAQIAQDPDRRVATLPFLTEEERHRALVEWNDTARDYPRGQRIHQLFSQQARRTPDAIAASCDGAWLSYRALELRSNRIAHALLAAGVGIEDRIGLFIDRGFDYMAGMLGVLKAGAAFVPLDPRIADARVESVLRECEPVQTLVCAQERARLEALQPVERILCIEDALAAGHPGTPPPDRSAPNSLAYVIYTSGSTGKPKGVMIEHEGMLNHIFAHIRDQDITSTDVIAQIAVQTFDISVWQFLCAPMVGARTAIITGDAAWEPVQLIERLMREDATLVQTVPSHTEVVIDELEAKPEQYRLDSLRWFISHAETLTSEQCRRWFRAVPGSRMINGYGATEASDDTSQLHILEPPPPEPPNMSIGGVLANLTHYVLDEGGDPVPPGVVGEVYIGGIGVGRGYLGDPRLTARVFLPDPFSKRPGARLYRIGDLAKYRPDGSFEFLGRVDFQIRIRGFRVEIGEIETALGKHPRVKQCAVVAKKDGRGTSHLIGYAIPDGYPAPSIAELEAYLRERLPSYMIPRQFVFIDAFPVGRTGKMARNLLPAPSFRDTHREQDYMAPRNPLEQQMTALWADALHLEQVGIRDNFFQMGGHSLLAAHLIVQIRGLLGHDVPLRCLFEAPTIESFLDITNTAQETAAPEAPAAPGDSALARVRRFPEADAVPLAPAQVPVWYAYVLAPNSIVYNVNYGGLHLEGTLDADAFVAAWQTFLGRHDSFRVRFGYRDGRPVQFLGPPIELSRDQLYLDLSGLTPEAREAEATRLEREYADTIFDLEQGPLFRLAIVDHGQGHYQILFVTHHVIWDEQSLMNMYREISELYNARLENRTPRLPTLEVGYLDYAQWMNECVEAGAFEVHRRFWLDAYRDMPPALDLPTDFPRPPVITYHGDWVFSWLPRDTARRLDVYLAEQNVTLFMFMLALLDLWLYRVTGQEDIVIGCPIAGRDHDAFQPLIGLFATPMPIRCRLDGAAPFTDLMQQVAKRSVEAYEHHLYPATNLIEELQHVKDLSRPRLFSIMYGVQHDKTEAIGSLQLAGLRPDRTRAQGDDTIMRLGARFDLNFIVDRWSTDVCLNCIYNTDLFRKPTVERIVASMAKLVDDVLADPDRPLWSYRLLGADRQLDPGFNRVRLPFDTGATLVDLFERQAERSPDHPAVRMAGQSIGYGALHRRVQQLRRQLVAAGVAPGARVALLLDPSPDMIASMLAVLAAGACYVPVSPSNPQQRIAQIIEHAGVRHTVTSERHASPALPTAIVVDGDASAGSDASSALPDERSWGPDALAYIIYTSGTTGIPKGIPIRHQGVVNLLASTQAAYGLTPADRVLFVTPYTFDASILDVFWPLCYGATVVIPEDGASRSPVLLGRTLATEHISVVQTVPIMLEALAETRQQGEFDEPASLRVLICGGDAMSRRVRDLARAVFPSARLVNHYGPTEVTVDATTFDCAQDFDGEVVPIGKPIANAEVFVLDDRQHPVPPGVIGEIHVSSPGVADGYLDDEALTRAAFVAIAPGDGTVRHMYRTGDLGKLAEDGTIYFIGRRDKQVKVRGNRVEIEEVNQTLLRHDAVAAATVSYIEHPQTRSGALAAFVELKPRINRFDIRGTPYRAFTLSQRPDLAKAMTMLHLTAWPAYFEGDAVMRRYWPRLFAEVPDYQIGLVTEDGRLAAAANAVPIHWDGQVAGLPRGWSMALARGLDGAPDGAPANTFMLLTGVVAEEFRGCGLSTGILHAARAVATGLGMERIIVAVRPTGKTAHPGCSFEEWSRTRRPDGQLADDWLRMHERVGGRILDVCLDSQRIEGSLDDWARWTGWHPTASGEALIPDTLQPAEVRLEERSVSYHDPSVWFEHSLVPAKDAHWIHVDRRMLREFLGTYLPDYMVPDRYRFMESMPLTHSGTIDERALRALQGLAGEERIAPKTPLQKQLAALWNAVLRTDDVGITDDFFESGGHSLKAIQLLANVQETLRVKIPLVDFYRNSTIRGLEKLLQEAGHNATDKERGAC